MTTQYQRNNINGPRSPRTIDADSSLTLDDELVVADSLAGPVALVLPDATQIPGNTVTIKAPDGGTNSVTITGLGGQTIDGAASLVLSIDGASAILESDGANWQNVGGGGGGAGGFPETQDEGVTVVVSTDVYNFTGAGVTVSGAGNTATVAIPGGSVPPLLSFPFFDSGVTLVVPALGSDAIGLYSVEANLSQPGGLSTSFIINLAVSSTGVDLSVLEIQSDLPVTTVSIDAIIGAGSVFLRLTGSGAGTASTINYRILDTIVRAFP